MLKQLMFLVLLFIKFVLSLKVVRIIFSCKPVKNLLVLKLFKLNPINTECTKLNITF